MQSFFVGIAGGSGSGKSTLSYALEDKCPDKVAVINFDDYQVEDKERVPMYKGFRNWDDPACIEFDRLLKDLNTLKKGQPIMLRSWVSRRNPDYRKTGERIELIVEPKAVIILEGYLSLYSADVRNLLDLKIYLDVSEEVRNKRRDKNDLTDPESQGYEEQVLKPMHQRHVEPTRKFADHSFDTAKIELDKLVAKLESLLPLNSKTVLDS